MRNRRIVILPQLASPFAIALGGILVFRREPGLAVVLVLVALITTVLVVRAWRQQPSHGGARGGGLSQPEFDLIVWTALAVPVGLGVLMAIYLIVAR